MSTCWSRTASGKPICSQASGCPVQSEPRSPRSANGWAGNCCSKSPASPTPTPSSAGIGGWSSATTGHTGGPTGRFRITHPFHPLAGNEYEMVSRQRTWGQERVFYYDPDGRLKSFPANITDLFSIDAFTRFSAVALRFAWMICWNCANCSIDATGGLEAIRMRKAYSAAHVRLNLPHRKGMARRGSQRQFALTSHLFRYELDLELQSPPSTTARPLRWGTPRPANHLCVSDSAPTSAPLRFRSDGRADACSCCGM
jgi:Family of unknown function (DUF5372)